MTPWLRNLLALLVLVLVHLQASATYSCSVYSPGFDRAYDPTVSGNTTQQTYLTLTCSRATSDSSTLAYSIAADNGTNAVGINNRASLSGNALRYDVYQDSTCSTQWKGNTKYSGTLNFGTGTTASITFNYWGCIGAQQTGLPAGIYQDTVTMTLTYGNTVPTQQTTTSTFPVRISTPSTCSISSAPGTVVIPPYTSFGVQQSGSASFGATCTAFLPYTVTLNTTSGTIAGLTYNLTFTSDANVTGPTLSSTGTGVPQTHMLTGTIPAGQAGTCATATCSGLSTHVMTLTY